jgi:cyanophycin synthetase
MEIERVRSLLGTNLWADFPVAEVWLDLSGIAEGELDGLCRRIRARVGAMLPACRLPRLGSGQDRTALELWLARSFARLTLALGSHLGRPGEGFLRIRHLAPPRPVIIAFPYRQELVPRACAEAVIALLTAVRTDAPFDLPAALEGLRSAAEQARPTPSAAAMEGAARARGIPVRHLGSGLLQLGHGARQVRALNTCSERLGVVAQWVTGERDLMGDLLASVGIACTEGPVAGPHYRVLVAGGRVAATIRWEPATGAAGAGQVTDLPLQPPGLSGDSPVHGVVTDLVHPEVCARALDAARAMALDIAEIRLVVDDPSRPLEAQGGRVSEVVAGPPLDAYLALGKIHGGTGARRPVAEVLLDALFPGGGNGRIPVAAVTGTNGKTTVTRLLSHALTLSGRHVGMTCTDGIYLAGRRIDTDDCAGPKSARLVLLNPQVEAAVLETARGGILREGLAFDACDLAVVTNIGEGDHLGIGGIETAEQLAEVKQTVVRGVAPWGTAVLNAADPLVVPMARHCRGSVLYFARDGRNPVLLRHRGRGGSVAFARDGALVLAQGRDEVASIGFDGIPLTRGGRILFQVENALACAGGMWALGLPLDTIRAALATFGGDTDKSPGRFNVLGLNGATAIFDYGHNPSALLAMVEALGGFPHRRRIAVYSAAGDRRDIDMIRQGEILGAAFDQVILYEDHYVRRRLPGEIMALFHQGLGAGGRVAEVQAIHGWQNAVEAALWAAQPGDLLLIQADRIDETVAFVRDRLAADQARRELPISQAGAPFEHGAPAGRVDPSGNAS